MGGGGGGGGGGGVLIDAVRQVDATVAIIGAGPLRGELEDLARRLGVTCNILLPGSLPRSDLKVMLHAAQAYVMSSVSSAETFSIAQLEAMAVGLPVVNTNLPTGVPHVARHGIEGLTVPPNDPHQLAQAISNSTVVRPPNCLSVWVRRAEKERGQSMISISTFHVPKRSIMMSLRPAQGV